MSSNQNNEVNLVNLLKTAVADFGSKITMAHSLSVEDMVITDAIFRNQLPIEVFSLDTGRLHQDTIDVLDRIYEKYHYRVKVFYPQAVTIQNYVNAHGVNAFYSSVDLRKQCCFIRKVEPLARALQGKKAWISGLRREQSPTRSAMKVKEWEEERKMYKLNPLLDWSNDQVWDYVKQHKVPYNKLHDQGYPSIGCAPCTRAIKADEDFRAGRWWWENADNKECGLHIK